MSVAMETVSSFSSRRPAAGALPAFSLPPPTSDIPRAGDGLSPSLSSVHTGSSQGSQAHSNMQYTYGGHVHGGWPAPNNSSYHVGTPAQNQQSLAQSAYGARSSIYSQPGAMSYGTQRNSQSPATGGETLSTSQYDQVHQPFQTSLSGAGAPHDNSSGAMLTPQSSTQPQTPSSASAHDAYAHSRPASHTPNYTSSAPHHQTNYSYAAHTSPTNHSPTSNAPLPRGLGSLAGQQAPSAMAPPGSYRPSYQTYQQLPTMSGPVMSNMHQPGGQMSLMSGMVPQGYAHHQMMYSHAQPQPQSERPFKCDQCVQSFSRNHDLKRHKRIHLAVKPFPCSFCSKSFSRKDALKRHRLVKGCETKVNENTNAEDVSHDRNGEASDDGTGLRKSP